MIFNYILFFFPLKTDVTTNRSLITSVTLQIRKYIRNNKKVILLLLYVNILLNITLNSKTMGILECGRNTRPKSFVKWWIKDVSLIHSYVAVSVCIPSHQNRELMPPSALLKTFQCIFAPTTLLHYNRTEGSGGGQRRRSLHPSPAAPPIFWRNIRENKKEPTYILDSPPRPSLFCIFRRF